jgi:hypothetical protein
VATQNGWRFDGLTKSRCVFGDVTITYGSAKGKAALPNEECRVWGQNVLEWLLKERPDLVILSMSRNYKLGAGKVLDSRAPIAHGVVRLTQKLKAAGIPVGAIKHTPRQRTEPPACMSKPDSTVLGCSASEAESLSPPGFLELASGLDPSLKLLDFDDAFCRNDVCPVVIGNVFVYRDAHHLTATFASTLSPVLDERIKKAFPTAR